MRARWHLRVNAIVIAWLVLAAVVAVGHRWVPAAGWLMTHLLLLGGASTAILIWSAHFAQAVRRRPLRGGQAGQTARLAMHNAGAITVVVGLLAERWPAVAAGAGLVAAGALWHAAVLIELRRGALGVRLGWTTWFFVASAAALPVGAVLGALLGHPTTSGDLAARAYVAHVAVMLLGWVGLAVVGTLVTLWPTILRVGIVDGAVAAARRGLVVLGSALVALTAAALAGWRVAAAAALAGYVVGLVIAFRPLLAQARSRPPETFAAWSVAAAGTWLLGVVTVWAVLVGTASSWPVAQARTGSLLAPLAVGFVAQVLVASLSHLGPMVLGGGPSAVRASRAVVERTGSARLVLVNGGLLLFVLPAPSLVRVGTSMVVLAALVVSVGLLLRAAVVSRRHAGAPVGPQAFAAAEVVVPSRRPARGPALAAGGALLLVVAGGVAADPAAAGFGAQASQGAPASGTVVEIDVEARDMRFFPDVVEVGPGDQLVITVTNVDDTVHDLVLDSGASSGRIAPGASARLDVGVVGRDLDGWCSVAGHRQMGMVLRVVVAGQGGGTVENGDGGRAHGGGVRPGDPEPSAAQDMDLRGEPAPDAVLMDPVLPPASGETVHRVTLEVTEVEREVAPGARQRIWTFGGTAPGPVLRGRVGDRFEITLVNDGTLGHSIDFHAGALAPDEPMRTIEPGQSLTFAFTATRSGVWMYHCSTMPMSLHIANGMFGAVVIDPPDLPVVDREYLLVQSELYLGPQGGTADADKVAAERPDAVAFNGYANQYAHAPLHARVGERVRLWVLDAGPNRPSAFHVVGGQFDTVYHEGAYLLGGPDGAGGDRSGGAQVLGLHPAQGGFVELVFPEEGRYPMVSHLMVDAERGAYGIVEVG